MRGVGGVAAAFLLAAASGVCFVASAAAETADGRDEQTLLFFSGTDLWRQGSFTHGGMLWSPDGLKNDGFTFKLLLGAGGYRYRSGALGNIDVDGQALAAFALPGWRFKSGIVTATVFAGADIQNHRLRPDDPSAGLRGSELGFRTGIELWIAPDSHTMISADASFSTVGPSYNARVAFGWRVFDEFFIGPEVQAFAGKDSYRQWRVGMHLTGLRTDLFEWSGGLGYAADSDDHDSLYARIGLNFRL